MNYAAYDTEQSNADYTTLGDYVFGQLGRLPKVGDQATVGPKGRSRERP